MADACYIQLMKYYMNSTSAEEDVLYVDLLADLIIKMNPQGKYSFHSIDIKKYNDIRKQKIKKALEQNKKTGLGIDMKKILGS